MTHYVFDNGLEHSRHAVYFVTAHASTMFPLLERFCQMFPRTCRVCGLARGSCLASAHRFPARPYLMLTATDVYWWFRSEMSLEEWLERLDSGLTDESVELDDERAAAEFRELAREICPKFVGSWIDEATVLKRGDT